MGVTLNYLLYLHGPTVVCEHEIFAFELSCKLRTFAVCSSGDRLDICCIEMLTGMLLTSLHFVPDSSDTRYICFPPGGPAVGEAQ